ncbi:MAG: hypothetical protein GX606_03605 [Elusimicrobia bacterium]|nr:hypothetical protein [Elusimicrobiota bacterium]
MGGVITIDMTRDFIEGLSAYIEENYLLKGRPLERLAVVFGGKRPGLFLKRALARRLGRAFVPPSCWTIEELMCRIALGGEALRPAMPLEESFEIYRLASERAPELLEGRETFAAFMPWATEILDLIAQLDLEDVGGEALSNVEASARIGFSVPQSINHLLTRIQGLREDFHGRLRSRGQVSRGMIYRIAEERIAGVPLAEFDEIIVANLFYFHRTEEAVIRALHERGQATLIFQGDQRKWPVLERIAGRFGCDLTEGPFPTPTTFDLKVSCASDVHGEAALVRDILGKVEDLDRTVIVVPDEEALVPLLSALPQEMSGINVSMGYPLSRSSLWSFLESLFSAQLSRREGAYYARDYLQVLRHPFVKNLKGAVRGEGSRVLVHRIEEVLTGRISSEVSGKAFLTLEEIERDPVVFDLARKTLAGMGEDVPEGALRDLLHRLHAVLFSSWNGVADLSGAIAVLEGVLDLMSRESILDRHPLNGEAAARLYRLKDEMAGTDLGHQVFSAEEVLKVLRLMIEGERVSFSGTPLQGLQVLGLFETRSLNFDHVIVLDVNEGVLPRLRGHAGIIPREVMGLLGLDRMELEEEIQRYQFMRVISSAKTVHLIYQKNREREPSRFLEELTWEKQVRDKKLQPYPVSRGSFEARPGADMRSAPKSPAVMEHLKGHVFSPSGINTYLNNPYDFYLRSVLGVRPPDDLLDEPDAAYIGNLLHGVLEEAFRPLVGKKPEIDQAFEKRFWSVFEERFAREFSQRMRSDAFLVRAVMEHKLRAFLDHERGRAPRISRILALETEMTGSVPTARGAVPFRARLDRIDEMSDGEILILDYKSGSADPLPQRPLLLADAPRRAEIQARVRSFQLPLYMLFAAERFPGQRINAGLFSLRETAIRALFDEKHPGVPVPEFLGPYLQALEVLLEEIFDPGVPFVDDPIKTFD